MRGVDYIGVGVGAIIVNEDGYIFLARRGPNAKNERGLWEFPGGSVEFGETLSQALQREMLEEYGIEIIIGELVDLVDHMLPQEKQHWVSPTYTCKIKSGVPKIQEPKKCVDIQWFDVNQAPNELTQITRINLEHYIELMNKKSNI